MLFDYKPLTVFMRPSYLAAFDCVFKPALVEAPSVDEADNPLPLVATAFDGVRARWNGLVRALKKAKHPAFSSGKTAEYAANCPPFGI